MQNIDWSRLGSNANQSHCHKVKEFLKLAGNVHRRMDARARHPFCDPREVLNQSTDLSIAELPSNSVLAQFPLVARIVMIYLRASELADKGVENARELRQAYELLIDVFRDGGIVDMHHGDLIVDDSWSTSLNDWVEKYA